MYVDGFILAVPGRKMTAYRRLSLKASKIWKEFGALEYKECVSDDLTARMATPFLRGLRIRKGEKVVFSWITYKSRAARDRANAKIMKDPRLEEMMDPKNMPFDVKRMAMAGFKVLVDA